MKEIKCTVVGDAGVGKACLISTFINGEFPEIMEPAVFQQFLTVTEFNGKPCKLQVWYVNGLDKYNRLRLLAYPGTDIVLLCFSVDDRESFESAKVNWTEEIHTQLPDVPVILVGTKSDTRKLGLGEASAISGEVYDGSLRPVSYQEGLALAAEIGAVKYLEVSSRRHNSGITSVFQEVVKNAQSAHVMRRKEDRCKGCNLM